MPATKKSVKTERLELRLSRTAKNRLAAAAELSGKTITDVVATAVDLYLDKLYSERFSLASLTREDKIQMVKALLEENNTPPTPELLALAAEYKNFTLESLKTPKSEPVQNPKAGYTQTPARIV